MKQKIIWCRYAAIEQSIVIALDEYPACFERHNSAHSCAYAKPHYSRTICAVIYLCMGVQYWLLQVLNHWNHQETESLEARPTQFSHGAISAHIWLQLMKWRPCVTRSYDELPCMSTETTEARGCARYIWRAGSQYCYCSTEIGIGSRTKLWGLLYIPCVHYTFSSSTHSSTVNYPITKFHHVQYSYRRNCAYAMESHKWYHRGDSCKILYIGALQRLASLSWCFWMAQL